MNKIANLLKGLKTKSKDLGKENSPEPGKPPGIRSAGLLSGSIFSGDDFFGRCQDIRGIESVFF